MTRPDYTAAQRAFKSTTPRARFNPGPLYLRIRLVAGGAPCALKLLYAAPNDPVTGEPLDRSPRWQTWLNGNLCDNPSDFIIEFDQNGNPIVKGEEIDAAEAEYLLQLHRHAVLYDATAPEADPRKPVNRRAIAPILPPR